MTLLASAYYRIMASASTILNLILALRVQRGKENRDRLDERRGIASAARPEGPLIWLHAASVGETLSVLSLVRQLLRMNDALRILITTTTVTAAELLQRRLAEIDDASKGTLHLRDRVLHQFLPLDNPRWVGRFLDHWQPNGVIWTESELWPVTLRSLQRRNLPLALVNGRMSERSFQRWLMARGWARDLIGDFDPLLTQTPAEEERFRRLGGDQARCVGNLKLALDPLPADAAEVETLSKHVGNRPAWLLASSHAGEEEIALHVHRTVLQDEPDLLTVIAPRHPDRAGRIAQMAQRLNLSVARRSKGEYPQPWHDLYLADTLGDMGLLYRVLRVVCMGGSLIKHGGHNPFEPAQLGCAIVHGPNMSNFAVVTHELHKAEAAMLCESAEELTATIQSLLADPDTAAQFAGRAERFAEQHQTVLPAVIDYLRPTLARAAIALDRDD